MSAANTGDSVEASRTTFFTDLEAASATLVDAADSHMSLNGGTLGTAASQSADKSKGKVCGVCNDHEARYKCSRCQLP